MVQLSGFGVALIEAQSERTWKRSLGCSLPNSHLPILMQTLTKKQMTLVRGRSLRGAIIAFALLSVTAWAQQAPVTPTFEAASVKYNSETPGRGDIQRDPGRVTYRNIRLLQLIML